MSRPSGSAQWARRLPPLAMGALALALMVAILPSTLHVPSTGPNAQAEVAPVPGAGQNQSNLSQLGLAESGTVGGGSNSAVGDSTLPPEVLQALLPSRSIAQQARCVGNPARQTEDPLSPPCVGFWQGNNGGQTSKGVDGNTITIVVANEAYGHDGREYTAGPQAGDDPIDRTARVLLRFFQRRFQTYGRTIRLVSHQGNLSEADAEQRWRPFAVIPLAPVSAYETEARKNKTMVFTGADRLHSRCPSQQSLETGAPFVWCMNSDPSSGIAAFADYVCAGLVGKPASMSTDPTLQLRNRKFAMLGASQAEAQPQLDAFKQVCGLEPEFIAYGNPSTDEAKLQADSITSVFATSTADQIMADAVQQNYFPEWIWNRDRLQTLDSESTSRAQTTPEWNTSFGLADRWRWKARPQPYYYRAYQEIDPSNQPDGFMGSSVYYGLLMAFTAIQMAGPNLTPANVQNGLQKFTATLDLPYSPRAGYHPGESALIDDYMIVRWDSTGSAPDGTAGNGCLRLADGGQRYLASGPWPTSDRAAGAKASSPCQPYEILPNDSVADENHN